MSEIIKGIKYGDYVGFSPDMMSMDLTHFGTDGSVSQSIANFRYELDGDNMRLYNPVDGCWYKQCRGVRIYDGAEVSGTKNVKNLPSESVNGNTEYSTSDGTTWKVVTDSDGIALQVNNTILSIGYGTLNSYYSKQFKGIHYDAVQLVGYFTNSKSYWVNTFMIYNGSYTEISSGASSNSHSDAVSKNGLIGVTETSYIASSEYTKAIASRNTTKTHWDIVVKYHYNTGYANSTTSTSARQYYYTAGNPLNTSNPYFNITTNTQYLQTEDGTSILLGYKSKYHKGSSTAYYTFEDTKGNVKTNLTEETFFMSSKFAKINSGYYKIPGFSAVTMDAVDNGVLLREPFWVKES